MTTRGVYRGVYAALFDDPDFQALPPHARLALLTLRQCAAAGAAAIFRYYPAVLQAQTGLSAEDLEAALVALEQPAPQSPWIIREWPIVWVRNGLKHDPHVDYVHHAKHRQGIERALASLPRLPIVERFRHYYGFPIPHESLSGGYPGSRNSLPDVSRVPSERLSPPSTSTSTEKEKEAKAPPSLSEATNGGPLADAVVEVQW